MPANTNVRLQNEVIYSVFVRDHTQEGTFRALIGDLPRIHALGCEAGISIKPKTPVEVLFPILKDLDLVLVMTVEPGFGGQKLIPGSTDRIRKLRAEAEKVNPSLKIEVDGGVKLDNVKEILDSGANLIVAGSAVYGKDTLGQTKAFMEILKA